MAIYIRVIVPPLLLVGGAVWLDLRTRRGYGLALLATTLIALSVWGAVTFEQAIQQAPSSELFAVEMIMAVLFAIGLFAALLLWIGALIEAGAARQRGWIAGLVAAQAPGLFALADVIFSLTPQGLSYIGLLRAIEGAFIVFSPTLAVLAYGIRRSIRPARQLAGGAKP